MHANKLTRFRKQMAILLLELRAVQQVVGVALHELKPHHAEKGFASASGAYQEASHSVGLVMFWGGIEGHSGEFMEKCDGQRIVTECVSILSL